MDEQHEVVQQLGAVELQQQHKALAVRDLLK